MSTARKTNSTAGADRSHLDAGDGVERTAVQARGGVRRGMLKVLLGSTMLAVVGIGAVFLFLSHPRKSFTLTQTTTPGVAGNSNTMATHTWDSDHLGANGLEKCQAFRLVVEHTRAFQVIGGGTISAAQRSDLQEELSAAKAMPPRSLIASQCGVPL
jgi:hypothetical protein